MDRNRLPRLFVPALVVNPHRTDGTVLMDDPRTLDWSEPALRWRNRGRSGAYAAAYPLELLVRNDQGTVRIQLVGAMFRMKMFFEDAGKWAFMKNIGMPGSMADEVRESLRPVLPEGALPGSVGTH